MAAIRSCSWLVSTLAPLLGLGFPSSQAAAQSVRLNGPLPQPGAADVDRYLLSADSTRIVFRAGVAYPQAFELFTSTLDGGAGATLLSAAFVQDFLLSDSGRVVYSAGQTATTFVGLRSIPADGSALFAELSRSLVPGGNVTDFALAEATGRVVFRADKLVDERFELFSVPLDGSAAPVQLVPNLDANTDVADFRVSADGQSVVFVLASPYMSMERLAVVPVDGSQLPHEIATSGTPPGGLWQTLFSCVEKFT